MTSVKNNNLVLFILTLCLLCFGTALGTAETQESRSERGGR